MQAIKTTKTNLIHLFWQIIVIIAITTTAQAQSLGFEMDKNKKSESIPFEYVNGFIIVEVVFNQVFPLKFIFDTGASNTLINNKEIVELFDVDYGRTFTVYGADLSTPMYAHLVKAINLSSGNLEAPNQDILVLESDYFNFRKLTGIDVHGILGADMFRNYQVKINYQNRLIQLIKSSSKKLKTKGYQQLEMVIQKSKPYVKCNTTLSDNNVLALKLLVDTGASTALLLNTLSDSSLTLPQQIIPGNLGFGIGGTMQGYVGRIPYIELGDKRLENVICHFQENNANLDSLNLIFRHGIVGNFILDRFEVIIDYPKNRFFLKPSRKWKRKFAYDKSGLSFVSIGLENKTYYINSILKGSPADLAGLQIGDIIKKINSKPSLFLSYDGINRILRGEAGKKVNIKVLRAEQKLKFEFRLKDLI